MNKAFLQAVIIYTLSTCPWCHKAKNLFDQKKVAYEEIIVDKMNDAEKEKIREELLEKTGQKTFPQIFINNKSIGGYSDLENLNNSGELDKLLEK
ncbi:MAG: glutaredoxin 3 [Rickettsia endosymbiont of Bryobia graminum]|nr:glutaredoxin 3 [Rickettsia endosymbiont of Bryobia graminum]